MAYAGQQFGGWVPQLGDGRAILLGEVIDQHGGWPGAFQTESNSESLETA